MADTVALNVRFSSDGSGLVADLEDVRRSFKRLDDEQKKVNDSSQALTRATRTAREGLRESAQTIATVTKAAAAMAVVLGTTATAALVSLTRQGLQTADSLGKTASRLGVNTEALAGLRLAAEQTGVAVNQFDTALQRVTRRTAEAAAGTGEAQAAFKALGLDASQLINLAPDEILNEIADALNKVENSSQKVLLTVKLFDQEGAGLVNTLVGGSAALAEYRRQAEILGLTLDESVVAQIENANDSVNLIQKGFSGFQQQLAGNFAPIIQGVADDLFAAAEEAGGVGKAAEATFNFIIRVAKNVVTAIDGIRVAWSVIVAIVKTAQAAVAGFVSAILEADAFISQLYNEERARELERLADSFARQAVKFGEEAAAAWAEAEQGARDYGSTAEELEFKLADYERRSRERAEQEKNSQEEIQDSMLSTKDVVDRLTASTVSGAQASAAAWLDAGNIIQRSLGGFLGGGGGLSSIASGALLSSVGGVVTGSSPGATGGVLGGAGLLGTIGGGLNNLAYRGLASTIALTNRLGLPGVGGFLGNVGSNLSGLPGGLAGGIGLTAGGGLLGGLLSDAIFGSTGLGNTVGGISGSLIGASFGAVGGPIGALVGNLIGGALADLFGGDGVKRANVGIRQGTGLTASDYAFGTTTAASGLTVQGLNRRGGSEGRQAAEQFLQSILGIDAALTGLLGSAGIGVDFSRTTLGGIRADAGKGGTGPFFGLRGENGVTGSLEDQARAFVVAWLEEVNDQLPRRVRELVSGVDGTAEELVSALEVALSIDNLIGLDVVQRTEEALRELGQGQGTLLDQYDRITEEVVELAGTLDGSLGSMTALNDALVVQKTAAAELAAAYRTVGIEVDSLLGNTIQSIRESVLSEEELYNLRRSQISDLTGQLGEATSPDEIAALVSQIDQLARSAYGILDSDQQRALSGDFISFLTNANTLAQDQITSGLSALSGREAGLANTLNLETYNAATARFDSAIDRFGSWVERLEALTNNPAAILPNFNFSSELGITV